MISIANGVQTFFGAPETLGYAASSLVLATFCMKRMVPLRIIAICSNFAFLTYGLFLHLMPIVILHAVLVPINLRRLTQTCNPTNEFRQFVSRGCACIHSLAVGARPVGPDSGPASPPH